MSTFNELYGVGAREAMRFFYCELTDLVTVQGALTREETKYVASILAHYAQTSRWESGEYMPPLANLAEVFDFFVLERTFVPESAGMLEEAGAQTLLLAGFFGNQMRRRHNLNFFDSIGSSFYERARCRAESAAKRTLLGLMSSHFAAWTRCCRYLNRTLQERPFLLKLPQRPES